MCDKSVREWRDVAPDSHEKHAALRSKLLEQNRDLQNLARYRHAKRDLYLQPKGLRGSSPSSLEVRQRHRPG